MNKTRIFEILNLTLVILIGTLGVCWGPPIPPTTPVSTFEISALTAAGIAGYGFWKMRKK